MVHGCHYAKPIPLSSSMASFENEEWVKFNPSDMRLPTALLNECYDRSTKKEIKKMYEAAAAMDHAYLKEPSDIRRNVGTIAILCGTWFET